MRKDRQFFTSPWLLTFCYILHVFGWNNFEQFSIISFAKKFSKSFRNHIHPVQFPLLACSIFFRIQCDNNNKSYHFFSRLRCWPILTDKVGSNYEFGEGEKKSLEHYEILCKCCLPELALGIVLLEHSILPQGIGVKTNLC